MCEDCGCGIIKGYAIDGVESEPDPSSLADILTPGSSSVRDSNPFHDPHFSGAHDHDHEHEGHSHEHDREGHSHSSEHDHEGHSHAHEHDHEGHSHPHEAQSHPGESASRTLLLQEAVLGKNDRLAERNRGYFRAKSLFVLNVLSSPGSGKTAFLERTLADLAGKMNFAVIVGDLETDNDAVRLRGKGAPVAQITTGSVCHLEAEMVTRAAERMDLSDAQVLFIENVGNLVCPAAYDLGEDDRIALLSVTEGEDKPLKYPTLFKSAGVVVINKIDIAEAVGFNREAALSAVRRVAPQAIIFETSARTGEGMEDWYAYLEERVSRLAAKEATASR